MTSTKTINDKSLDREGGYAGGSRCTDRPVVPDATLQQRTSDINMFVKPSLNRDAADDGTCPRPSRDLTGDVELASRVTRGRGRF